MLLLQSAKQQGREDTEGMDGTFVDPEAEFAPSEMCVCNKGNIDKSEAHLEPSPLSTAGMKHACDDQLDTEHPASTSLEQSSSQSRQHRKRRKARNKIKAEQGHVPRPRTMKWYLNSSTSTQTDFHTTQLPSTHGAYTTLNTEEENAHHKYYPQDLDAMGFTRICWNGRDLKIIHDKDGRVLVVLAGQPSDPSYAECVRRVGNAFATEGEASYRQFTPKERDHKRGKFPAVNVGVSPSLGGKHPVNLDRKKHQAMTDRLLENPNVKCMANFASTAFQAYQPKIYSYYREHLDLLFAHPDYTHLKKIFPYSIYPAATFNFGPSICTFKHCDTLNCPFGICAIQSLGTFDHTVGGHLILWDLKIYVDFPAGSLILILSATMVHSNTPTSPGEFRASFTQYCGGNLFRFVDNDFKTEAALHAVDPVRYQEILAEKDTRWKMGLKLFSTLDELVDSVKPPGLKL